MHNYTPLPVSMVRCRLDGSDEAAALRYVPAERFELWQHLMVTKHDRLVSEEQFSVWIPDSGIAAGDAFSPHHELEPVVRIRFDKPGPQGTAIPVERFFPAETSVEAQKALLAHFDPRCAWTLERTPGYFVSESKAGCAYEQMLDLAS